MFDSFGTKVWKQDQRLSGRWPYDHIWCLFGFKAILKFFSTGTLRFKVALPILMWCNGVALSAFLVRFVHCWRRMPHWIATSSSEALMGGLQPGSNKGLSVLPSYTLACGLEDPGIKPLIFWWVDDSASRGTACLQGWKLSVVLSIFFRFFLWTV